MASFQAEAVPSLSCPKRDSVNGALVPNQGRSEGLEVGGGGGGGGCMRLFT